jgi:hypothetical protein
MSFFKPFPPELNDLLDEIEYIEAEERNEKSVSLFSCLKNCFTWNTNKTNNSTQKENVK